MIDGFLRGSRKIGAEFCRAIFALGGCENLAPQQSGEQKNIFDIRSQRELQNFIAILFKGTLFDSSVLIVFSFSVKYPLPQPLEAHVEAEQSKF